MERLLCIVGGMNVGGAETFLMKIFRELDREKYQMDFAAALKGAYDDEIRGMGGKIFYITPKSQGMLKNFSDIRRIVKENHYQSVLRVSQNSLSALELFAAQLGGAKKRGFRSSNSNTVNGSGKEIFVHRACGWMPMLFANVRFAPSVEAAEFMFGKGCIKNGKAFLLRNGLNVAAYRYDENERKRIRHELGLEGCYVVGHVGRFNQQKNHRFLLDVFAEVKKARPKAILVLCGIGEKQEEIRQMAIEKGIAGSVLFLGIRTDIPAIMSAMDVFVFPSLYEGMPNTVIEAQVNGLPCVISDSITGEAALTSLVSSIPLDTGAQAWCNEALQEKDEPRRETYWREIQSAGYDIAECAGKFVKAMFGE